MIHFTKALHAKSHVVGEAVDVLLRTAQDLTGFYRDDKAFAKLSPETPMYEVDSYFPVEQGVEGGLFFGMTRIYPGKVGREYFMTKGHFHEMKDRGEFYWGVGGEGLLLLMDEDRNTWAEKMHTGSIHYIPGFTAHRVCNTGKDILTFGACWPSDAGHDYGSIQEKGFSKLAVERDEKPTLIPSESY